MVPNSDNKWEASFVQFIDKINSLEMESKSVEGASYSVESEKQPTTEMSAKEKAMEGAMSQEDQDGSDLPF